MKKRMHLHIEESEISVSADELFFEKINDSVREARGIIKRKIREDPFFGITYDPYPPTPSDDLLIRRMCLASVSAGVGPMAAVAGAVATYVIEALIESGCKDAVIDNGGDIALISENGTVIKIYSGNDDTEGIGLRIPNTEHILGICTSSGRIGHSISFGNADVATVISEDPILADACATALGNMISDESNLSSAVERICRIEGVKGCFAFMDGSVASCGDVPEFISLERE